MRSCDTAVRVALRDGGRSAIGKYRELVVGRAGWWPLIRYEFCMMAAGGVHGGLGWWLRGKLWRGLLGSCGRGVQFGRDVVLRHPHGIHLGDGVVIDDGCMLSGAGEGGVRIGPGTMIGRNTMVSAKGGAVEIGENVNIGSGCTLISESRLRVCDGTLIAGHTYMIAGGNHGVDEPGVPIREQALSDRGGVHVGCESWIGAQAVVLDGSYLGEGSVVAAGAVVRSRFEDHAIVAGVPARVIRIRGCSRRPTVGA